MDINEEIVRSLRSLDPQIENDGAQVVYRRRVQAMAKNGDLAILAYIIDQATGRYRNTILAPSTHQDVDLARGGILALRGIWVDLRNLGIDPEEEQHPATTEQNEFGIIPEIKEDLTRTY